MRSNAIAVTAGVNTLGDFASAIGARTAEAAVVAELKAGSEEAYAWLIGQFHQPVYNLVYRIVSDPSDAADTTQEVFIKIFRGIRHFHGESTLKTWIYRIAVHEASNRRRWWFRHKAKETPLEPVLSDGIAGNDSASSFDTLVDGRDTPFDCAVHAEIKARVTEELRHVPEPYRTTLILRDLEELSYEEIAEVTGTSLGTVKSRLTRGREALKRRLASFIEEAGPALGLEPVSRESANRPSVTSGELEVAS
jgi:RNA polymerase sigma-70 factor (ECF subfamily)